MLRRVVFPLALALVLVGVTWVQPARAVLVSLSGGGLSASANFTTDGAGNLTIVLTNTSGNDVTIPAQVLTAVFFDILGVGPLTPISAILSGGSVVFHDPDGQPAGGVVGGEYAYGSGLSAPLGATEGVSSAGFGLFGNANFPGANLDGPTGVDGLNYGITSAGDNTATGNAEVTGNVPLIQNQVTFVLSGLDGIITTEAQLEAALSDVSFQYGTALTEPNLGVPEPATLLLLGTGLVGIGAWSRRKFRGATPA